MNTLRKAVQEYLTLRRNLGFKLYKAGKLLPAFVKFLEEHRASYITTKLALAWAQQPSAVQPVVWAQRLSVVRTFARHRSATDPRTQIPSEGLLPYRPKRAQPYLYSAKEIKALLRAALSLPARRGLRPWTYHCLLGLLSVTGLRLSEARNLEIQDVDLQTRVLTIRNTKFGKTRLIPIHASTRRVLADYLARRGRWARRPACSYVFVSNWGNQLDRGEIHRTFYALSRQVGLRGPSDRRGPRLHDMRHRFAAMTLLRWHRSGKDVERKLPYLSAYLGHVRISDTYWYLSAWPELMREAMSRVERCWEGQS
jgi:integrase/recombinase XerD